VSAAASPLQLTVVGGFLGAGKTTLVNRLLSCAKGRYLVLVNDFGAVNIDADLIAAHDGDTIRLTNGCVCCSLADNFLDTLIRLLDGPLPFDQLIVEASGVGDPYAIAEIALVEPDLALNAVVVVADAERIVTLLADPRLGDTVRRQIAGADLVLLNKIDLVAAGEVQRGRKALVDAKPGLRVVPVAAAAVPHDLLGLGPRSGGGRRFTAEAAGHEQTFTRALYRGSGCFDRAHLGEQLDRLPPSVLRLKGICRLAGFETPFLLQMVGARWSMAPQPDLPVRDFAIELVAIGTPDMPSEAALGALFDAALATGAPA
jgi:G3E family GTPase